MPEWKKYRKTGITEMRPHVVGESLEGVSVNEVDNPDEGGWVARNPENHDDKWFVAKKYFDDNYEDA